MADRDNPRPDWRDQAGRYRERVDDLRSQGRGLYDKVAPDFQPPKPPHRRPRNRNAWQRLSLRVRVGIIAVGVVLLCGCGVILSSSSTPVGSDGSEQVVPNLVGMDYQSAQDKLSPDLSAESIDATGRGRVQLVDSHWMVVRQDVAPGTKVGKGKVITLFVTKSGESTTAASPTAAATRAAAAPTLAPVTVAMPNVVGQSYEDGVLSLGAAHIAPDVIDATGQGRATIDLQQWRIVRQVPRPGVPVRSDSPVKLYVVKIGETDAGVNS